MSAVEEPEPSSWTEHRCEGSYMVTRYGRWILASVADDYEITFCPHCGIRLPTSDPAEETIGVICESQINLKDLVVVEHMPRQPWNRGHPISEAEVEGLRLEFQRYVDTASEGRALGLLAWCYLGGLKTMRQLDESYSEEDPNGS